jgi:Flp pilus assembly protein TadG
LAAKVGTVLRWIRGAAVDARGSEIVEFAVAMPLLAFFLIGIFDFSQAYGIKHKLSVATREGARFATTLPTTDLSDDTPPGPTTIREIVRTVGQSLENLGIEDCGLATLQGSISLTGALTWQFTGNQCTNNPILTINRGFVTTASLSAPYPSGTMTVENTQVTLQYPYTWTFGKLVPIVVPGGGFTAPVLRSSAVMQNLN